MLSAGQRERVAIARALFGDPFLVVFDEPNANLDHEGEVALQQTVRDLKARGAIAIIVAHRPSALASCDKILYLAADSNRHSARATKSCRKYWRGRFNHPDCGRSKNLRVRDATAGGDR